MNNTIYEQYNTWTVQYMNSTIYEKYIIWTVQFMNGTIYEQYNIWKVHYMNRTASQCNTWQWNTIYNKYLHFYFTIQGQNQGYILYLGSSTAYQYMHLPVLGRLVDQFLHNVSICEGITQTSRPTYTPVYMKLYI